MSSQNKKSINQVVKSEFKFLAFFTAVLSLPWIISQVTAISDAVRFSNLGVIGMLQVLVGLGDFSFTNIQAILIFTVLISIGLIPLYANAMARRINGQETREAIDGGFADYKNKRTWNYALKVLLPVALIGGLVYGLIGLIPNSIFTSLLNSMISSIVVTIIVALISIIISVLLATIGSYITVGYIVYLRSDLEIKAAFQSIDSKIVNFLLGFNVISVLGTFGISLAFIAPLLFKTLNEVVASIMTYIIWLLIVLLVYNIVISFFRNAVYMSAANNANVSEHLAIDMTTDGGTSSELSSQNPFAGVNPQVRELTIKPKHAKHKNRINTTAPRYQVKRSIK